MAAQPTRRRFAAALGATFACNFIIRSPARAAEIEIRCAGNFPTEHPITVWGVQMWKAIERESNGRVRTQFFPNSVLGGDTAMLTQLRSGALQFQMISPTVIQAVVPNAAISEVAFAFKDEADALRVMDGPLGAYVRNEIAAQKLHALNRIWNSGTRVMTTSSKAIKTASDLRGMKFRTPISKLAVEFFKALGASATGLNLSELYTALETKVVDGEDAPYLAIETLRLFEVQKFLSVTNHSWSSVWMVANGDAWDSYPRDIQEMIERNNTKYALLERADSIERNRAIAEKLGRQGLTVIATDRNSFRPALHEYYKTVESLFPAAEWTLLESAVGKLA